MAWCGDFKTTENLRDHDTGHSYFLLAQTIALLPSHSLRYRGDGAGLAAQGAAVEQRREETGEVDAERSAGAAREVKHERIVLPHVVGARRDCHPRLQIGQKRRRFATRHKTYRVAVCCSCFSLQQGYQHFMACF